MADLKVVIVIIKTGKRDKLVQLCVATEDGTYQTSITLQAGAAARMGHALVAAGKSAESKIITAGAAPVMGRA